ncbi:MAG: hypothetical protein KJZ72_15005 [Anaerolineales bacterium]|nr:hypothetical protein [Anaerolineales bacterium]
MQFLFHQPESDTRQSGSFFAMLYWLTGLIWLTEEEQEAASIYLENLYDDGDKS